MSVYWTFSTCSNCERFSLSPSHSLEGPGLAHCNISGSWLWMVGELDGHLECSKLNVKLNLFEPNLQLKVFCSRTSNRKPDVFCSLVSVTFSFNLQTPCHLKFRKLFCPKITVWMLLKSRHTRLYSRFTVEKKCLVSLIKLPSLV